jgi:hypothetical protein
MRLVAAMHMYIHIQEGCEHVYRGGAVERGADNKQHPAVPGSSHAAEQTWCRGVVLHLCVPNLTASLAAAPSTK